MRFRVRLDLRRRGAAASSSSASSAPLATPPRTSPSSKPKALPPFTSSNRVKTNRQIGGVSSYRQSRFEPATRSLATFVPSHRSLRSLATLASLARSVHGLAHSLCSLPRGTVENLEYVFTLLSRFTGTNAFLALTRNTPTVQARVAVGLG